MDQLEPFRTILETAIVSRVDCKSNCSSRRRDVLALSHQLWQPGLGLPPVQYRSVCLSLLCAAEEMGAALSKSDASILEATCEPSVEPPQFPGARSSSPRCWQGMTATISSGSELGP
nr:unnamed protein product [Digitaria exilis]